MLKTLLKKLKTISDSDNEECRIEVMQNPDKVARFITSIQLSGGTVHDIQRDGDIFFIAYTRG